ncbi:MAG: STAS/SEC14 domain-containing protein [Cyclobacteriaceae bacterium]
MVPPNNAKVIEFPTSTIWFDENGILCSIAKKVPQQTIEEAKTMMEEFRKITGGKKICILSDSTDSPPVNKEMRDYFAEAIPEIAKAIAIISRSAVGKMVANLFFSIKKQPYPVKMFSDETEAKEWLKQYL